MNDRQCKVQGSRESEDRSIVVKGSRVKRERRLNDSTKRSKGQDRSQDRMASFLLDGSESRSERHSTQSRSWAKSRNWREKREEKVNPKEYMMRRRRSYLSNMWKDVCVCVCVCVKTSLSLIFSLSLSLSLSLSFSSCSHKVLQDARLPRHRHGRDCHVGSTSSIQQGLSRLTLSLSFSL